MDASATARADSGSLIGRLFPQYADNRRLSGYVLVVVAAGVALLLVAGGPLRHLASLPFLTWLAISVAAEFLWLETLSGDCTDSMASTVNFVVIFLFGNPLGLWIIGLSVLLATRFIQKRDWVRSMFGLGQMSITACLCGFVFHAWQRLPVTIGNIRSLSSLLGMLTTCAVYYFVNTGLVAGAVALQRRTSFRKTWFENYAFMNSIVSSVALFAMSPIVLVSYLAIGDPGVLLFFLPLLIVKNQNREYINLQKMTRALISTERMAAKGEMAAEVAHEINNYLAVLSGRTQLLLMRAGKAGDASMRSDAEIIRQQIVRMSTLAKGLLEFSHREIHVQTFDLNRLVEDTIDFVRPQNLFDGIALETALDPEAGEVVADAGQLQQVLLNLLRNAADAIRAARSSRDEVESGTGAAETSEFAEVAADPGPASSLPANPGGPRILAQTGKGRKGMIRLSVEDNGPGMTKEIQARIFEPAFTTKPDGHGYGLATCYRILQNHGGRIWVESEPGRGAVFILEFPRRAAQAGAGTSEAKAGADTRRAGGNASREPEGGAARKTGT